jgi:alpha-amylase/alpha-mannosidase (GH57 family)
MTANQKYICIHGHFYQPPRENPWLEAVEAQETAAPYHDWNARITAECYGPNGASRILDGKRRIIDIVNNYSRISFNFGPTLLSWMEHSAPEAYRRILEADRLSRENFSGHGSAFAQAYSHMIMPLANPRDRRTQVLWGIADFQRRFDRYPEGMWLPETAVDTATLEVLAEGGIRFTILAPRQAKRVRSLDSENWENVEGGRVDPKMPYLCRLPSGKSIVLFFYDGPPSQEIAFSNLLENGEWFARRLLNTLSNGTSPRLAHIATDGETYGHHRAHGDMALAACLRYIQSSPDVRLTVYGEYLEKFPPTKEAQIVENSSWSCIHGVERWRSNCGCNSGLHPGWTQAWRQGLRDALDWLRDRLAPVFEEGMKKVTGDPWRARDEYIEVILDRGEENVDNYFRRISGRELSPPEQVAALKLLEMQRHLMLMYTSCGWFFDEISGLETVQILQYAARAIQLASENGAGDLEGEFSDRLSQAPGNVKEISNGALVYRSLVLPSRIDLAAIGAQYGVSSLFQDYPEETRLYSYQVQRESYERTRAARRVLATGTATLRSRTIREEKRLDFAALYLGDNTVMGGVKDAAEDPGPRTYAWELKDAFLKSDLSSMIRLMDSNFPNRIFGLKQLLAEERRKMVNRVLEVTVIEVESSLHKLAEHHYPLIQALREAGLPLPPALAWTVQCTINTELREALKAEKLNLTRLKEAVAEAHQWHFRPDNDLLRGYAEKRLNELVERFAHAPEDTSRLTRLDSFLRIIDSCPLQVSLWSAQNRYFLLGRELLGEMIRRKNEGDPAAGRWLTHFSKLGRLLRVFLPLH